MVPVDGIADQVTPTVGKGQDMLPYWIDLSISDLLQGTGFVVMAIMLLTFQFLLPSSRA